MKQKPHKGIFWIAAQTMDDYVNRDHLQIIACPVPADCMMLGNSKNGNTNTHAKTWDELVQTAPREIRSKPWNYYPRGRVEIRFHAVKVFLHPVLLSEPCRQLIIETFFLEDCEVTFIADHSSHYHCLWE